MEVRSINKREIYQSNKKLLQKKKYTKRINYTINWLTINKNPIEFLKELKLLIVSLKI